MLVVFLRAAFLYVLVTFSLRLMGKRQLGELQPTELVITILISNIASLPIEDANIPMVLGAIPVLVLVAFELVVSNISLQSKGFRSMVSGKPVIVIQNGQLDQRKLRKLRFSIDDLMESLRQQGIFVLEEGQYAIVETTGKVSVLPKFSAQTVTPEMLRLQGKDPAPPVVVISDGQILQSSMRDYNISPEWLESILEKRKIPLKKVFLLTIDQNRSYRLSPKQDKE